MRMRDLWVLEEAGKRVLPEQLIADTWVLDYQSEHGCSLRDAQTAWGEFMESPLVRIHNILAMGAYKIEQARCGILNGLLWLSPVEHRHGQDLNESGRDWFHRRGWIYFKSRKGECNGPVLGWSLSIPSQFFHAYIRVHEGWDDEQVSVSFGCGLFAAWLHVSRLFPDAWLPADTREWGISFHDGAAWISINNTVDRWSSDDPWWQHIVIHFDDIFLGEQVYKSEKIESISCLVPMPEGCYPAIATRRRDTWKRPRWKGTTITRYEIEMLRPIPIPGKGENGWDCDDDAIYSRTSPAENLADAITELQESVRKRRRCYGGDNWVPYLGFEHYLTAELQEPG